MCRSMSENDFVLSVEEHRFEQLREVLTKGASQSPANISGRCMRRSKSDGDFVLNL